MKQCLWILLIAPLLLGCQQKSKPQPARSATPTPLAAHVTGETITTEALNKVYGHIDGQPVLRQVLIRLRKGKVKMQDIPYTFAIDEVPMDADLVGNLTLRDVTFDGLPDLLIYQGAYGNQGAGHYDCYVQDAKSRQFVHAPTYAAISNPDASTQDKAIYSAERASAAVYVYKKYTFSGTAFVLSDSLVEQFGAAPKPRYSLWQRQSHRLLPALSATDGARLPTEWRSRVQTAGNQ